MSRKQFLSNPSKNLYTDNEFKFVLDIIIIPNNNNHNKVSG